MGGFSAPDDAARCPAGDARWTDEGNAAGDGMVAETSTGPGAVVAISKLCIYNHAQL